MGDKTILWSIKKQKWFFGPEVPNSYSVHGGCAVPINRNAVIILGVLDNNNDDANNVFSFNFESHKWTKLKKFPTFNAFGSEHPDMSCSCSIDKSNNR